MSDTVILIPARMGATRLPNKPLAEIDGKPMIVHVMQKAMDANVGDVFVAAAEQEICDVVAAHGGRAILTDPALPTGTDRIYAAYKALPDYKKYKYILNLQGDLPTIDSECIVKTKEVLQNSDADISSLVAPTTTEDELTNINVVKVALTIYGQNMAHAHYFSRLPIPHGAKTHYHHLGIYGFRAEALEKFVNLKQTDLELSERLEQLRALENGMKIDLGIVKVAHSGVDTIEDLERARNIIGKKVVA